MSHAHRRYLDDSTRIPTTEESHRLSLALASYSSRLSSPVNAQEADALLAASTLINALSFNVSSTDPTSSWPLVSSPDDLQWLSVQQGPGLIIAATSRWLDQSAFLSTFSDFDLDVAQPPSSRELYGYKPLELPPAFFTLCGITADSTPDSNPYLLYLDLLAPLLPLVPSTITMAKFLPFISSAARSPFFALLQARESRALLILAWWYAMILPLGQWWLAPRVRSECVAICMYLEQREKNELIRELLEFPSQQCNASIRTLITDTGRRLLP